MIAIKARPVDINGYHKELLELGDLHGHDKGIEDCLMFTESSSRCIPVLMRTSRCKCCHGGRQTAETRPEISFMIIGCLAPRGMMLQP